MNLWSDRAMCLIYYTVCNANDQRTSQSLQNLMMANGDNVGRICVEIVRICLHVRKLCPIRYGHILTFSRMMYNNSRFSSTPVRIYLFSFWGFINREPVPFKMKDET